MGRAYIQVAPPRLRFRVSGEQGRWMALGATGFSEKMRIPLRRSTLLSIWQTDQLGRRAILLKKGIGKSRNQRRKNTERFHFIGRQYWIVRSVSIANEGRCPGDAASGC